VLSERLAQLFKDMNTGGHFGDFQPEIVILAAIDLRLGPARLRQYQATAEAIRRGP
jgi:hypothetical protein